MSSFHGLKVYNPLLKELDAEGGSRVAGRWDIIHHHGQAFLPTTSRTKQKEVHFYSEQLSVDVSRMKPRYRVSYTTKAREFY